ncbi:MAG: hypothetical protein AAFQ73_08085 [Pseudomonadota bacterium]
MSRSIWIAVNGLLVAVTFAMGWFAVNAPQLARPSLESSDAIAITVDPPPLPPAPFIRSSLDGGEAITPRPLFSAPETIDVVTASTNGPGPADRNQPPIVRSVINPPIMALGTLSSNIAASLPAARDFRVGRTSVLEDQSALVRNIGIVAEVRAPDPGFAPKSAPRPFPHPDRQDILDLERRPGVFAAELAPRPRKRPEQTERAINVTTAPEPAAQRDRFLEDPTLMTEEGLILIGVFQSRNSERAIIKTPSGEAVRVTTGDEIEGWRVSSISADRITLRRASQTRMLKLADAPE